MPLSDEVFEYDRSTKPFSVSAVIYYGEIFHLRDLKQASGQRVSLRHFSSGMAENPLKQINRINRINTRYSPNKKKLPNLVKDLPTFFGFGGLFSVIQFEAGIKTGEKPSSL